MKIRLVIPLLLVGVWLSAHQEVAAQKTPPPRTTPRTGTIFVVDGSGDDDTLTENFRELIKEHKLSLGMVSIRWCQFGEPIKDHTDHQAQVKYADRLAVQIALHRSAHPSDKIYVIGQSSGTHVVLRAATKSQPKSMDRVVVMASTVSSDYDLRPALRASRNGIDSFYSSKDRIVLMARVGFGTADKQRGKKAGGEVGFTVPPPTHPDAELYKNLRQHRWNSSMAWTGHIGGHLGFTRYAFLNAYVLPLMLAEK